MREVDATIPPTPIGPPEYEPEYDWEELAELREEEGERRYDYWRENG